ncbi:MAG: hypothetical protein EOL87_14685 [Spartobacteria bacterium]|nr:hypothetical protein [Spartobacteria bacterium]
MFNVTFPEEDSDAILQEQLGWTLCKILYKLPNSLQHTDAISHLLHHYARYDLVDGMDVEPCLCGSGMKKGGLYMECD